jgi:hypothetical protein
MNRLLTALLFVAALVLQARAADPDLVGTWFGEIDTDRGQMEIGLVVTLVNGKLVGTLKTGHGDWEVTGITVKDGQWTVAFRGGGNEGQMAGRVSGNEFSGEWKSKMANGTFDLSRSKRKAVNEL